VFLDFAAGLDREVILYQISTDFLPVAHDFGFSFFKLGRRRSSICSASTSREQAKTWRQRHHKHREGGRPFRDRLGGGAPGPAPGAAAGVDDGRRQARRREALLHRPLRRGLPDALPVRLVRDQAGRVTGFANVLEGPRNEELSVDLMRYSARREQAGGMHAAMDYLFLKLCCTGRSAASFAFNLGMAPLAAVGEERWAGRSSGWRTSSSGTASTGTIPGLRRYKEKFDPVWEPRYMAYPRPWDWPLASTTTAALIAGVAGAPAVAREGE